MLPEMTPHEIANEISLRQIHSRIYGEGETFVMVEGKTDQVLWEEFRAKEDCTLYPTQGKGKILAALQVTKHRNMRGVAGIVDADYWLITEADELSNENMLFDDCCPDMEMILLRSDALRKVLRHELENAESDDAHAFADALTRDSHRLAAEVGYFRLLNECNNYGLNFKSLMIADFVDGDPPQLDCEWLARRLAENRSDISSEQLLNEAASLREAYPPDNIKLCRGKDVIAIIASILSALYEAYFNEELPDSAQALTQAKQLAKELSKAYEYIYFQNTSLFQRIRSWENNNSPFRIIRDFPDERTPA